MNHEYHTVFDLDRMAKFCGNVVHHHQQNLVCIDTFFHLYYYFHWVNHNMLRLDDMANNDMHSNHDIHCDPFHNRHYKHKFVHLTDLLLEVEDQYTLNLLDMD
eukprot:TRINITY_DN11899_c0_g1_i20.p4 TRINITY_DN11899_c0_g1~~TRINITY_DN11899_c0_g1_i20.p4  ORF type:complete len:103 (-),score=10.60 TRINITY_DN11899_c0_g1_i20:1375-1683(-)